MVLLMMGMVIVSHSAKLATAVVELARQMTTDSQTVALAAAGGIDDPDYPFGTDVIKIQTAIESVYTDAGVLVLMDLGSAILSAEMALEFFPPHQRENIKLCEAPLVEGAMAAVIQASTGANIEQVIAEAKSALKGKASHLAVEDSDIKPEEQLPSHHQLPRQVSQEIQLTVNNPLGLHARPAAKFVTAAAQFASQIRVQNLSLHSQSVNAKSINEVITLGVRQGHEIRLEAVGEDAAIAIDSLQQLLGELSEETRELSQKSVGNRLSQVETNPTQIRGILACGGIAIGKIVPYQADFPEVEKEMTSEPQQEWQQLQDALASARQEIASLNRDNHEILKAHLLYLEDPIFLEQTKQLIFEQKSSAAAAWKTVIQQTIAKYQSLTDFYLQERAIDVKDVGMRVLRLLTGKTTPSMDISEAGILVASDVTPSEVIQLSSEQVLGICTAAGSATSHSAMLANLLGIPMVVGVGEQLLDLAPLTQLAFNGETGEIWLNPTEEDIADLTTAGKQLQSSVEEFSPVTEDGKEISVMVNILGVKDAQKANLAGGVGLLRTELLYLGRLTPPTEEEQYAIYRQIAQAVGNLPLTIRTADLGGDKPVAYLHQQPEANPFLGWRGIRQSLDCRKMFETQLKAILRASDGYNIRLMLPMVSQLREVVAAKEILQQVRVNLRQENRPCAENIPLGIMIEVPAAVTMADKLATEVDFFSIGTNDLSQYVMACDRTNPRVASLADGLAPPVLRMIEHTVKVAHQQGIKVSVCGQLASDLMAVPILVGLGVDELSVNPPVISKVKEVIARLKVKQVEKMAHKVLDLDSAAAVREYLNDLISP
jgi:phosphocarrier protein FPr